MPYCAACGKEISDRATACPACGNPVQPDRPPLPPPPPPPAMVRKNSHPVLTFIGIAAIVVVVLVVVLILVVALNKPAPVAKFVATDNITDETCTQITDYCISVHCTYQNQGDAAGERRIRAQLLDKASGDVRADHYAELTLLPNASQRFTFTFPEAELNWQVSSVCKVDADVQ